MEAGAKKPRMMSQALLPTSRTTRKEGEIFGLGLMTTPNDSEITGARLPTKEQVLRCFRYHQSEGLSSRCTKMDIAKIVLEKIKPFYLKGNIPMLSHWKACDKIIALAEKNAKLCKIPVERRSSPKIIEKLKQAEVDLKQTFPLWPSDAEKKVKNADDLAFLVSMKTDRKATIGGKDKVTAAGIARQNARQDKELQRKQQSDKEKHVTAAHTELLSSGSSEEEDLSAVEVQIPSSRRHKRIARPGTTAFIPHNVLRSPRLVALATRIKMTPSQQASFTKALIEEGGGDASKVVTSYSSADRARRSVGLKIAASVKSAWIPPTLGSLHWDSKILSSLKNPNVMEERLAIAVGDSSETKLLGTPAYLPGSDRNAGDIISEKTMSLLNSWGCADNIVNMVFDTTASNTGHVTAACVSIQQALGRALLWSACRHHVGEIVISNVFTSLKIEGSKSPDVALFSRFRANYEMLQHSCEDSLLSKFDPTPCSDLAKNFITTWQAEALMAAKSNSKFQREDYKEFSELCEIYLREGGDEKVTFRRPGALHKARWMAKVIYALKIELLKVQIRFLPPGTITTRQQVPKVREFVQFVSLLYYKWWSNCSSVVDAPWNDLQFYKNLILYESINPAVALSALAAFKRHLWYITPEMVPLALFSDLVPCGERQKLANRLVALKPVDAASFPLNRFGLGFGKPKFPQDITSRTDLADIATADSWFIFTLLHLNPDFLCEDLNTWEKSASYIDSKKKAQSLNVVNDGAERAVKLSSEYTNAALSEQHYQNVLQVVESDRKATPNLRK